MKLALRRDGGFVIEEIDEVELGTLRAVREEADTTGVSGAEERLFPDPVRGGEEEDAFRDDWGELVHDEIRTNFLDAVDVQYRAVIGAEAWELSGEEAEGEKSEGNEVGEEPGVLYRIVVRANDVEKWYAALNQARLVMYSKYEFPDTEAPEDLIRMLEAGTLEPFLRWRMYAAIQEWLVDAVMGREI